MDDLHDLDFLQAPGSSLYGPSRLSGLRPHLHILLPSYSLVPVQRALRVWHKQAKSIGEDLPPSVLLFGVSRTEFVLRRSIEESRPVDWKETSGDAERRRDVAFLECFASAAESRQPLALLRGFLSTAGPLSLAPAEADGEGGDPTHAPLDRIAAALEAGDEGAAPSEDWDRVSCLAALALATGRVGDLAACARVALRAARRCPPPPRPAGAPPAAVEAAVRERKVQLALELPSEELLRAITTGSRARSGQSRDSASEGPSAECAVAVGPRHVYVLDRVGLHKGLPLPASRLARASRRAPAPALGPVALDRVATNGAVRAPPPSAPAAAPAAETPRPAEEAWHGGPYGLAFAQGVLAAFAAPAHAARAATPAPPASPLGRIALIDPVSLAVLARVPLAGGEAVAGPSDEPRLALPPEACAPFALAGAGPALYLLCATEADGSSGGICALELRVEGARTRSPRLSLARALALDAGSALGGAFGKLTDERRRRARAYTNGQEMVLVLPDTAGGPLHYAWRLSLAAPRAPPLAFATFPPGALDSAPAFAYDWYRNRVCVAGVRLALASSLSSAIASALRASVATLSAADGQARADPPEWGMSVDPDCWGGEEEGEPGPPSALPATLDGDESDLEEGRAGQGSAGGSGAATSYPAVPSGGAGGGGVGPSETTVAFFPNGGLPDPDSPFCRGRRRAGEGADPGEWGPAPPPPELGAPAAGDEAGEAWASAAALLAHAARLATPYATPRSAYGRAAMRRGVHVHRPRVTIRIYNGETMMRARPTALSEDSYRTRGADEAAPRLRFRLRYYYLMCRDWLSVALEVDGEQRGGPVALFSPDRSALRLTEEGRHRGWTASTSDLTLAAPARDAAPNLAAWRPAGPRRPAHPDALACFTARRCGAADPFAPPFAALAGAPAAAAAAAAASPSPPDPWARYTPDQGEGTPRLRPFCVDLSVRALDNLLALLEELAAAAAAAARTAARGKLPAAPAGRPPLEAMAGQALRLLHAQLQQLNLHAADLPSLRAPAAFRDAFVGRLEGALLALLQSPAPAIRDEAFAALRAALPTAFCEPRHLLSLLSRVLCEGAPFASVLECASSVLQPSAAAGRALAALAPPGDELPPLLHAALERATGPVLAALRAWPASDPWAALASSAPLVRLLARYFQPSLLAAAAAPEEAPAADDGAGAALLRAYVARVAAAAGDVVTAFCAAVGRPPADGAPARRAADWLRLLRAGVPGACLPALWAAAEPSDAREAAAILALAGAWGDAAARVHELCRAERAAALLAQRAAERIFLVPLAGELDAEGEVAVPASPALPAPDLDVAASVEGEGPAAPFLVRLFGADGRQAEVIRSLATGRLPPPDGSLSLRTVRHERRLRLVVAVGPRAAPRQPPSVLGGPWDIPGAPATPGAPAAGPSHGPPPPPPLPPSTFDAPAAISADAALASERFGAGTGAYEGQAGGRTVVRTAPSSIARQLVFFSRLPLAPPAGARRGRCYAEVRLASSTAALLGLSAGPSQPRFLQSSLRTLRFFWVQHGERFAGGNVDAAMESAAQAATFGPGDTVGVLVDYGAKRLRMFRNGEAVGSEDLATLGADVAEGSAPLHLAVGLLNGSATLAHDAQPPVTEEDDDVALEGRPEAGRDEEEAAAAAPAVVVRGPLDALDAGAVAGSTSASAPRLRLVVRPGVGACDEWQWPSEQRLRALECLARRAGSLVSRAGGGGEEAAARHWLDRPLFFQAAARLDRARLAAPALPGDPPFLWRLLEGDEPARAWLRALRAARLSAAEQLAAAAVGPGAALVDDAERAALAAALKYGPAGEGEGEAAAEAAEASFNRFLATGALAAGDPSDAVVAALRRAHAARVALVRRSTALGGAEEPEGGRYAADAEGVVRRARLLLALRGPLASGGHGHPAPHAHSHPHPHKSAPRPVHALLPPARTRSEGVERDKLLAECSRVLRSGAPLAASVAAPPCPDGDAPANTPDEAARFVCEWGLDARAMTAALERREALARRRSDGLALFSALLALPPSGVPFNPRDWQLRVGLLRVLARALRGDSFAGGVLCCGPAEQGRVSEAFASLASQLVASLRPAPPPAEGPATPPAPSGPEVRAATLKALLCMSYRRCEHDVLAGSGGLLSALESLHVPLEAPLPALAPAASAVGRLPPVARLLASLEAEPALKPPPPLDADWDWAVFELQVLLLCTMAVQAMRNAHAELPPEGEAADRRSPDGDASMPDAEPQPSASPPPDAQTATVAVALRALAACSDALQMVSDALQRSLAHPEAGQLEDIPVESPDGYAPPAPPPPPTDAARLGEAARLARSLAKLWRAAIRLLSAMLRAAQLHPTGREHVAGRVEALLTLLDLTGKSTGENGDLRDYEAQTQWVVFELLKAALPVCSPDAFGAARLEALARAAGRRFLPPRALVAARRLLEKFVPQARGTAPAEELILWRVASWGAVSLFRSLLTASGPAWRAAARRLLLSASARAAALLSLAGDGADVEPESLGALRTAATLLCALGPCDYPNYGVETSLVQPSGRETRALVVDVDDLLQDDASAQLVPTSALGEARTPARGAPPASEGSDGEDELPGVAELASGGRSRPSSRRPSLACLSGLVADCRLPAEPAPLDAEAVLGPEGMAQLAGHLAALLQQGADGWERAEAGGAAEWEAGRVPCIRAKLAYMAASAAHALVAASPAFRAAVAADAGPNSLFAALLRSAGQAREHAPPLSRARYEAHRLDVALWTVCSASFSADVGCIALAEEGPAAGRPVLHAGLRGRLAPYNLPLRLLSSPPSAEAAAALARPLPVVAARRPNAFPPGPREPFICVLPLTPIEEPMATSGAEGSAPVANPPPPPPSGRTRRPPKRMRLLRGPSMSRGMAAITTPSSPPDPAAEARRVDAAARAGAAAIVLYMPRRFSLCDVLSSMFQRFRSGAAAADGSAPDEPPEAPPPSAEAAAAVDALAAAVAAAAGECGVPVYLAEMPAGAPGPDPAPSIVLDAVEEATPDFPAAPPAEVPPAAEPEADLEEAFESLLAGFGPAEFAQEARAGQAQRPVAFRLLARGPFWPHFGALARWPSPGEVAIGRGSRRVRPGTEGGAAAEPGPLDESDEAALDAVFEEQDMRRLRRRRALRAARRRARRHANRAARGGGEGRGEGREGGGEAGLLELVDRECGEISILSRSRSACAAAAALTAAATCCALVEAALPDPDAPADGAEEAPASLQAAASSAAGVRRLLWLVAMSAGPLGREAPPGGPPLAARLAAWLARSPPAAELATATSLSALVAGAASTAALDGESRARVAFPVAAQLAEWAAGCDCLPRSSEARVAVWVRPRPLHGAETAAEEVRVSRDADGVHRVDGGALSARGGWGPVRFALRTPPELFGAVSEADAELGYTADLSARLELGPAPAARRPPPPPPPAASLALLWALLEAGGAAAAALHSREAVTCLAAAASVAQGTAKEDVARLLAAVLRSPAAVAAQCAAAGAPAPALLPLEAALVRFANSCAAAGPASSALELAPADAPSFGAAGPLPPLAAPALELLTAVSAARAAWRAAGLPEAELLPEAPTAASTAAAAAAGPSPKTGRFSRLRLKSRPAAAAAAPETPAPAAGSSETPPAASPVASAAEQPSPKRRRLDGAGVAAASSPSPSPPPAADEAAAAEEAERAAAGWARPVSPPRPPPEPPAWGPPEDSTGSSSSSCPSPPAAASLAPSAGAAVAAGLPLAAVSALAVPPLEPAARALRATQAEVERLRRALAAAQANLQRSLAAARAMRNDIRAITRASPPPSPLRPTPSPAPGPAAPPTEVPAACTALERLLLLRDVLASVLHRTPLPPAFVESLVRGGREALGLPPGPPLRPPLAALLAPGAPFDNDRWAAAADAELRALLDGMRARGELPALFAAAAAPPAGALPPPSGLRHAAARTAATRLAYAARGGRGEVPPLAVSVVSVAVGAAVASLEREREPPPPPPAPGACLAGPASDLCEELRRLALFAPHRFAPVAGGEAAALALSAPAGGGGGGMTVEGVAGRAAVLLGIGRLVRDCAPVLDTPAAAARLAPPYAGPPATVAELVLRLRAVVPDKRANVLRPALAAVRPLPSVPPPYASPPDGDGQYVRQRLSVFVDKRKALAARLALSSGDAERRPAADGGARPEEGGGAWPPPPGPLPEAVYDSVFGQLFTQLAGKDPRDFQVAGEQGWHTSYTAAGEEGVDMGGLFRETISLVADELNADWLPLFVPTPNARSQVGPGQDEVVPRAAARGPAHLALFEFAGRLMGLALRTGVQLPLRLPPAVWRALACEPPAPADLRSFDALCHAAVEHLRRPAPADEAPRAPPRWYPLSDGTLVDLWPRVAAAHRCEAASCARRRPRACERAARRPEGRRALAAALERLRLRDEFGVQVAAIRRGVAAVAGPAAAAGYTGDELAVAVCGEAEVDLERLKRHTAYAGGARADDPSVLYLWEVLRGFTGHERELFLRFVWGRSRLPASEGEWPRPFTVAAMEAGDLALPRAHTCFFQLDLPRYSSLDVARSKIWYAVTYCRDMGAV